MKMQKMRHDSSIEQLAVVILTAI